MAYLHDFMLTVAQEYYATMDDDDRKEWVEMYMGDWDALKTYFEEVLEDLVRNDELRVALLRTVKWYDVWKAMKEDIAENYYDENDDKKDTEENDEEHQD